MAKSKYDEFVKPRFNEIGTWVKNGFSEAQIAAKLGISKKSLERYKKADVTLLSLFVDAKKERDIVDIERTEKALMKAIEGGWVAYGDKRYYIAPNVNAIIFALKKLAPKKYGDKTEIDPDDSVKEDSVIEALLSRLKERKIMEEEHT